MKIIFATGIYPPEIGGPATYVRALAKECIRKGYDVTVVCYGDHALEHEKDPFRIVSVSRFGGPIIRWIRYASVLRKHGKHADIVYAFSSVSCVIPIAIARLTKPKKILRLGGDFLWERYTDNGGMLGLRDWYATKPGSLSSMQILLNTLDHIVFSTTFQQELYQECYAELPKNSVIENARMVDGSLEYHRLREPMRLLFMGRFVAFKNLQALLESITQLENVTLTLVGSGPKEASLKHAISELNLDGKVVIIEPVHGKQKQRVFREHDLLVIPSVTEISPNTALEARSSGLPVLLTSETGLSDNLTEGMLVQPLSSAEEISDAIHNAREQFESLAESSSVAPVSRSWEQVFAEHDQLFTYLMS